MPWGRFFGGISIANLGGRAGSMWDALTPIRDRSDERGKTVKFIWGGMGGSIGVLRLGGVLFPKLGRMGLMGVAI